MSKRSSRIAKRDEFQKNLRIAEEAIGSMAKKRAEAVDRRSESEGGAVTVATPEQPEAIADQNEDDKS